MNELRVFRIMAEFSDGAVINDSVTAENHDAARERLNDLIRRALNLGNGNNLIAGSDQVSLECVITRVLPPPE